MKRKASVSDLKLALSVLPAALGFDLDTCLPADMRRDNKIVAAYIKGASVEELSKRFDLSARRIREIVGGVER